jgi:hypothetical protein
MKFLTSKTFLVSIFGVVALIGCGGGSSSSGQVPTAGAEITVPASGVVSYITEVQAATSDSTEPSDISTVTLATDDTAEPDAV